MKYDDSWLWSITLSYLNRLEYNCHPVSSIPTDCASLIGLINQSINQSVSQSINQSICSFMQRLQTLSNTRSKSAREKSALQSFGFPVLNVFWGKKNNTFHSIKHIKNFIYRKTVNSRKTDTTLCFRIVLRYYYWSIGLLHIKLLCFLPKLL